MKRRILMWCASGILLAATATTSFAQLPFLAGDPDQKPSLAPLLREITPAVVNIAVESRPQVVNSPLLNDPFFDRFFGGQIQPEIVPQRGAGSGVIIDADNGYVLTNHHVIADAELVTVTLADKRRFTGTIIGSDAGTDIALVQIEADGLTALELGDSDTLEVGDFVIAIGNPFGLGQTVTSGIVSALGRGGINADGYEDFIQTDASINPGNSGGALIDLNGQLVGINSAIIAPAGGNVGIGFAVPSDMANEVIKQLLEYGEVRRGRLGIMVEDLTPDLADALGLDVAEGAVVREVDPNSPAERAGIEPGDVIVEFDGRSVEGSSDLRNKVGLMRLGSRAEVGFIREGRRQTVDTTIGETADLTSDAGRGGGPTTTIEKLEGADLRALERGDPQFGRVQGVLVASVRPNSAAERNGLLAGDIITGINSRRQVRSVQELSETVRQTRGTFALNIVRDGRGLFLVIR